MTNTDAGKVFTEKGIKFSEFNNGLHMRIVLSQFHMDGHIDFWPTRQKWIYGENQDTGLFKLLDLLEQLNQTSLARGRKVAEAIGIKYMTAEEMFQVAKFSKDKSLGGICAHLQKHIYGARK